MSVDGQSSRNVLLIDEDPNVGRVLRLSLHGPNCQVFTCTKHLEGLRLAARQKPDLILMETQFKGADGLLLGSKLLQAPETQSSALAFLTSDKSISRRVRAIQLGACDYLSKPMEGRTLVNRVNGIFEKRRRQSKGPVVGPAAEKLLSKFLELEASAGSCTITLRRGSYSARIVVVNGTLSSAEYGSLRNGDALNEIASFGDWLISFEGEPTSAAESESRRRVTEETNPAGPKLLKRADDSPSAATTEQVAPPPRLMLAPEPIMELDSAEIYSEDAQTVMSPREQMLDDGQVGPDEVTQNPALPKETISTNAASAAPAAAGGGRRRDLDEADRTVQERSPVIGLVNAAGSPEATEELAKTPADGLQVNAAQFELPEPGVGFEEEAPTAMSFRAEADEPTYCGESGASVPSRTAVPPAGRASERLPLPAPAGSVEHPAAGAPGHPGDLRGWLAAIPSSLLLAAPSSKTRDMLQARVEQLGFSVIVVSTGLEAYTAALQRHPAVIIADRRGPELDARELLVAVRSDFQIRETPFLIISSDLLSQQFVATGADALAPVLQGLEAAFAPRIVLAERLRSGEAELSGWVEPLGAAYLLRALGRAGLSGIMEFKSTDARRGQVILRQGEVCAASVTGEGEPAVGPLGLLNLVGYEWLEYQFRAAQVAAGQVPLGNIEQLVEAALQQNNIMLAKVYQQGFLVEDIGVDRVGLERAVQQLPPGSREIGVRLRLGDSAAALVERGVGSPGLLKSILHELRRKAVLQAMSMRPARIELDRNGSSSQRSGCSHSVVRRWLIVTTAGLITIASAMGAYVLYKKLQREPAATPKVSAPAHPR